MSGDFWQSPTYKIVQAMKATGNRPGIVAQWKGMVEHWATRRPDDPEAQAVLAWLPYWQARPFYTVDELAPMFPALAVGLRIVDRPPPKRGARRLEFELDYAGLPRLENRRQFFIVERLHHYRGREISDKEFQEVCNAQR